VLSKLLAGLYPIAARIFIVSLTLLIALLATFSGVRVARERWSKAQE